MGSPLVSPSGAPLRSAVSAPPKRHPMAIVRDAGGTPVPPTDVVKALQQWEPALGLKYHAVQWAFTWTWKPDDPRRQWIKESRWSEADAYDIIGYIPLDCPLEEVPAYAVKALKCYPRDEVRKLVDTVGHYNAIDVGKAQVAEVLDATLGGDQLGKDVTANSGTVSVVANIGHKAKRKRRKGTP